MNQVKTTRIGVEVDEKTDTDFEAWAKTEGRSKRRHAAILLERLTTLAKTRPQDLARLGLATHAASPQT